jgi:hypothetical protein
VRERIDLCVLAFIAVDATETGEGVLAVDVHRARTANTLATRATKSECRIYFILDLDKSIENLRTGGVPKSNMVEQGETTNHRTALV